MSDALLTISESMDRIQKSRTRQKGADAKEKLKFLVRCAR